MKTKEQVQEFLAELSELTLKHGIAVGGCGCCGSPFLEEVEDLDPGTKYATDDHAREIQWPGEGRYLPI